MDLSVSLCTRRFFGSSVDGGEGSVLSALPCGARIRSRDPQRVLLLLRHQVQVSPRVKVDLTSRCCQRQRQQNFDVNVKI